ncbi:hypothetical protein KC345_g10767 [Hortaea werneckii]|nr:hypothetical protein KC345_g10767 [Hortaea werneckii]
MVSWLPPKGMKGRIFEFDARAGGAFRMSLTYLETDHSTRGKTSENTDVVIGRFLEFAPDERMVQLVEFQSDDPVFAGEMIMTWTLAAAPEGTAVTIVCENVPEGAQALGASASLVGKTIQGEYTVNVYGKKLAVPAIVIDGKSYAPVRAIGELAGYKVSVQGKIISLEEKTSADAASSDEKGSLVGPVPVITPDPALTVTKSRIEVIDAKIDAAVNNILATSSLLKASPDSTDLKLKLDQYKAEYADLLKQKDLELQK